MYFLVVRVQTKDGEEVQKCPGDNLSREPEVPFRECLDVPRRGSRFGVYDKKACKREGIVLSGGRHRVRKDGWR